MAEIQAVQGGAFAVTSPAAPVPPWPYQIPLKAFKTLRFRDFPGSGIEEVAEYLYRTEPRFMAALEADVRASGVHQPVWLGAHDTIEDGTHRVAAAYRAGRQVPVAFYGEAYPRDRDEECRWDGLRASHPREQAARMVHSPHIWRRRNG